ncbi:MAG: hypothetical protein GX061_05740 [Eubacteriaceae bacterium]|nr:hypothetical protein [Eubacteriaceae bacterium]
MTEQKAQLSNNAIWAYSFYGVFQTWAVWLPLLYVSLFMTTYLGVTTAAMGTIFLVSKFLDFIICVTAGGIIESANFKGGRYLPWIKMLKWVIFICGVGQFTDISFIPYGLRVILIGIFYVLLNGSMNYVSTAQYGVMALMAGGNYTDRIRIAQRSTQVNAASSIFLSFGTVPIITFVGKALNNPAMGYTVVAAIFGATIIIGGLWLQSVAKAYDKPREHNAPKRKVSFKEVIEAITTNDQLIVYLTWQIIVQIGTYIFSTISIYYWTLVMGGFDSWYSIGSGIGTCFGFVFAMFIPKIGVKLGKIKSLYIAQVAGWVSHILYYIFGLKSYYYMTVISVITQAVTYLQMGFGANYILDLGEYGYYKTGKDMRGVVNSLTFVPMKASMTIGSTLGAYVLSWIKFDDFNNQQIAGTLDRTSDAFVKFQKTYMAVYCFVPLVTSILGFLVFKSGYKITDDKAVFYAQENAKKAAMAAGSPEA